MCLSWYPVSPVRAYNQVYSVHHLPYILDKSENHRAYHEIPEQTSLSVDHDAEQRITTSVRLRSRPPFEEPLRPRRFEHGRGIR
jgi:hypothetical protein